MTAGSLAPVQAGSSNRPDARPARLACGLSWALVLVAAPATAVTFLADVLNGPAVMNGRVVAPSW